MKILAFAGSNSSTSINRELVKFALSFFPDDSINLLDLNDYEMPIFSVDREKKDGYPEAAHKFLQAIADCDAIICSLAEHNRAYTVAFKNIFDWASRINVNVFQNKPMLLLSTSPGGYGGGNVMNLAKTFFPQFGADIKATFSLPKFNETFKVGEGIIQPEYRQQMIDAIAQFKHAIA